MISCAHVTAINSDKHLSVIEKKRAVSGNLECGEQDTGVIELWLIVRPEKRILFHTLGALKAHRLGNLLSSLIF